MEVVFQRDRDRQTCTALVNLACGKTVDARVADRLRYLGWTNRKGQLTPLGQQMAEMLKEGDSHVGTGR